MVSCTTESLLSFDALLDLSVMEKCVYYDLSEDTVSGSFCKFKLQARLLEAFTNESISLPCKVKLFRYAPAKLGF